MSYRTDKQASYLEALSIDMKKLAKRCEELSIAPEFVAAAKDTVDALAKHDEKKSLTKANASKAIDYIIDANRRITLLVSKTESEKREKEDSGAPADAKTVTYVNPHESTATTVTAGMYKHDGDIFRVYLGQTSGRLLVKKVIETGVDKDGKRLYGYEYVGSAGRVINNSFDRMTLDEVKKWGKMTETCCVCARRLDVPESVDAGIGPVCASRV